MDKQILLHNLISDEMNRFDKLQHDFQKELKGLTRGSLLNRNGHPYRAYTENGRRYQVPVNDSKIVDELSLRRHIKAGLSSVQQRVKICKEFLKNEVFYDPIQIHTHLPDVYHNNLSDILFPADDINIITWASQPYKRNPAPFVEEHYTTGGIQVRSKSEALIGSTLEQRKMIFRCEPEIWCGFRNYYPDFAVLLPGIRRVIYLEHFGKMDDPDYLKKTMKKLKDYQKHGLYLGYNFFFTWETSYHPLNMKEVHEILDTIQSLNIY